MTATAPHALTMTPAGITRALRTAGYRVRSTIGAPGVVRTTTGAGDERAIAAHLTQLGYDVALSSQFAGTVIVTLPEPTEGEPVEVAVELRTIGRDLYEVVRDGRAAGRIAMVEGARWVGYDLRGTARTEALDELSAAVAAVDALGCTPDAPRGTAEQVSVAVATWGGRLGDGPAALRALPAEARRDEVTVAVDPIADAQAKLDEAIAAEAAVKADPAADARTRRLAGRHRRYAARRLAKVKGEG